MYFIDPVITDLATVKVNEAISANQPLIFTKLSIGKGKQVGDLKKIATMKTHFMDLSIAKELQGETTKLFSRLSNEGFVDEAHITELGVFAKVGSTGPEFLFMYTCADQGDIVPPANRGAYIRTYRFETTLRNDGELTINVVNGGGVFLTPEDLEEHTNDKSNPHNVTKEQIGLVNATASVDGLMSNGDKFKLDTVELGANNYTHPTTHPPTIIAQTSTGRFVSDTEKSTWNAKAGTSVATTSANGLMASADKTKLDGVATGANNYTHPSTHSANMITETSLRRFMTDAERAKLNGIEVGASTNQVAFITPDDFEVFPQFNISGMGKRNFILEIFINMDSIYNNYIKSLKISGNISVNSELPIDDMGKPLFMPLKASAPNIKGDNGVIFFLVIKSFSGEIYNLLRLGRANSTNYRGLSVSNANHSGYTAKVVPAGTYVTQGVYESLAEAMEIWGDKF